MNVVFNTLRKLRLQRPIIIKLTIFLCLGVGTVVVANPPTMLPPTETPPVVLLNTTNHRVQLISHVEVLEDKQGEMKLADVLNQQGRFQTLSQQIKKRGAFERFSRSAYWFRTTVINHTDQINWYFLQWGGPNLHVDVYLGHRENGTNLHFRPLSRLRNVHSNQYALKLPKASEHLLYFRVQDKHMQLVIDSSLRSSNVWIMEELSGDIPGGFVLHLVVGGLIALFVYNLLYFLYLRDWGFLTLALLIVSFSLEMGGHMGLWNHFPPTYRELTQVGGLFGFITLASSIVIFKEFLNLNKNLPKHARFWDYSFILIIVLALASPFMPYSSLVLSAFALGLILFFSITSSCFYWRGFRLPASVTLAAVIFIVGGIPGVLRGAGLIKGDAQMVELFMVCLLLSLILLSLNQAEQLRNKQVRAERLAANSKAKDEFLTTMSHELRTPMNAVVSAGRLLATNPPPDQQKEYVSRLNIASQHMLLLINDVLDLARMDRYLLVLETIPFHMQTVLQQIEQLVGEQARSKDLRFVIENGVDANYQLTGDPTRLRQVLLNLTGNAVKFTEQGQVVLRVQASVIDDKNISLLFEVCDSGIGISTPAQQTLFQPFSQATSGTARQYGGSGLGLAISHKLVRKMGGELKVSSQQGKGSRFYFELVFPLKSAIPKSVSIPRPTQQTATTLSKASKVLLVDDDEMNRYFGQKTISLLGVTVILAESGQETLHLLQQQSIDLILMDISMPVMDGYETTRAIRKMFNSRKLPVIALTAHAIAGERERCLAAGMDDYLAKPFDTEELQQLLVKYIGNLSLPQHGAVNTSLS